MLTQLHTSSFESVLSPTCLCICGSNESVQKLRLLFCKQESKWKTSLRKKFYGKVLFSLQAPRCVQTQATIFFRETYLKYDIYIAIYKNAWCIKLIQFHAVQNLLLYLQQSEHKYLSSAGVSPGRILMSLPVNWNLLPKTRNIYW